MPKKVGNATSDRCLADWYQKSGLAGRTDTIEFRAKGNIEVSCTRRKEMIGTFCGLDTIRIVSCSGAGSYWMDMGYGKQHRHIDSDAPYAVVGLQTQR